MALVNGSLLPVPSLNPALDNNGSVVGGGKLYTYIAGTTTPQATYSDVNLTVPNTNPIILDASGRAIVYLQPKAYKLILTDSLDVQIWVRDNVSDVGQVGLSAVEFNVINSPWINLDNGAGVTIDGVLMRLSKAVTLSAARVVYVDATSGTVSGGSIQLGTTVGGSDIVAVKNYENSKAVGGQTNLTLAGTTVNAGQPLHYRHIGVAATQPGQVLVEVEFA
jgi:hypothetical protein